jgi:uncharacterized membrane protein
MPFHLAIHATPSVINAGAAACPTRYAPDMTKPQSGRSIGNRLAPARFLWAAALGLIATPLTIGQSDWRMGTMVGFDAAALLFLLSLIPLFRRGDAASMRQAALRNDANRAGLLFITAIVMLVILVAVAAELGQRTAPDPLVVALIIATLSLAWAFSNMVYALHYAHIFYTADGHGQDRRGIDFPGTDEPDYWDFTYFAFTLGMTFQTSDTDIRDSGIRKIATFHSLAAFVFNLGILAFTINVLGGG